MKLLLLIAQLCLLAKCKTDASLFEDDPNIRSLNDANLKENIFHQNDFTLIIFYSSWCGHCHDAAPILKSFAQDIRKWRAAIKVVALDCNIYNDACIEMNATSVPNIKLIPLKSDDLSDATQVNPVSSKDPNELYSEVLNFLNKAHRGVISPSLVANTGEICSAFPTVDIYLTSFAIIEKTPSLTSAEIILDLLNYRNVVQIRRFYDKTNSLTDSLSSIHVSLPAIVEVNLSACTFKHVMNSGQDIVAMKFEFERKIVDQYLRNNDDDFTLTTQRPSIKPPKVIKYKLNYIDMYNAMRYSILNEMLNINPYEKHHVDAIKQYFATILKYFPFKNENVRRLFKRMNIWLANKDVKNMNRIKLREAVKISDGFLWPKESYRFCNGSAPRYRGYNCGQWVLFHVLTVNEYLNPPAGGVKHEVLFTMRNYTTLFFSCSECARHFGEVTRDMTNQLTHPNSSVLYLWRTHNLVNHRLQGSESEDPFFPKIQFPSKKLCPHCVKSNEFQLPDVLTFLTTFYGKKSISNDATSIEISLVSILLLLVSSFASLVR